jgi:hypothetical protein
VGTRWLGAACTSLWAPSKASIKFIVASIGAVTDAVQLQSIRRFADGNNQSNSP